MKNNVKITTLIVSLLLVFSSQAQEKKIKFNKGTLKICSTKNFNIVGYDGDEVIINSLHNNNVYVVNGRSNLKNVKGKMKAFPLKKNKNLKEVVVRGYGTSQTISGKGNVYFYRNQNERKKGLKRLGKNQENKDFGIYFTIEQKGNELIFKDYAGKELIMVSNERYEIKIPNSIKLNWQTNGCEEKEINKNKYVFYNSKPSSLTNFDGEVEISTSLNNLKLVDVTGPVSINSIGGNVTVEFDKKLPKKLYSIYTNNGFIDFTLPSSSNVSLDVSGTDIFSDIDFKVEDEKEINSIQNMKLKLLSGKVKMKLNAGLGSIYLRKK